MKSPVNPVTLGVGLAVVALGVAGMLYMQRGAHVELTGKVLKVRTQAMDEASSVAVVDFRFVNSADYQFMVKQVDVFIEDKDGKVIEGQTVSELDARRLFQYYPLLGQKFNDTLLLRNRIGPRTSQDRMVAARFEVPEEKVAARRKITVRITDVDGPVSEVVEQK